MKQTRRAKLKLLKHIIKISINSRMCHTRDSHCI